MNLNLSNALSYRSIADAVALNPQPLPPKQYASPQLLAKLDAVALNPQPLPPKETASPQLLVDVDAVALNPQPLPPKELGIASILRKLDWASLNPQPLPPKLSNEKVAISLFDKLDAVALNPQPLPPKSLKLVRLSDDLQKKISDAERAINSEKSRSADSSSQASQSADHKARVAEAIRTILAKMAEVSTAMAGNLR